MQHSVRFNRLELSTWQRRSVPTADVSNGFLPPASAGNGRLYQELLLFLVGKEDDIEYSRRTTWVTIQPG